MSIIPRLSHIATTYRTQLPRDLASSITWTASKQTYCIIRLLADRERVDDAYRAYAYFRWVDDTLDQGGLDVGARMAFVKRQQTLAELCYRNHWPEQLAAEEELLVTLIRSDLEPNSGLQVYIRNMLAVMDFDARRRRRLVSAAELHQYTSCLAVAVTEAMHHFIGHSCTSPQGEGRYLAVTAAHITHMLRDTLEDVVAGYFNIPREVVEAHGIDPNDVSSAPYKAWIKSRVSLARSLFEDARDYLRKVQSIRHRLAAYAYVARFEYVLDAIERDSYQLRASYPKPKSLVAWATMGWLVLNRAMDEQRPSELPQVLSIR